MSKKTKCCGICLYSHFNETYNTMTCRLNPPIHSNGFTNFPKVTIEDYCWQFKEKKSEVKE